MYHTNVRATCTTRLRNILGVAGCARMMYLSSEKGTFLVTKSMPMVGLVSSANDSPWQRAKMLDFPTPEFPITTTFAMASLVSDFEPLLFCRNLFSLVHDHHAPTTTTLTSPREKERPFNRFLGDAGGSTQLSTTCSVMTKWCSLAEDKDC